MTLRRACLQLLRIIGREKEQSLVGGFFLFFYSNEKMITKEREKYKKKVRRKEQHTGIDRKKKIKI